MSSLALRTAVQVENSTRRNAASEFFHQCRHGSATPRIAKSSVPVTARAYTPVRTAGPGPILKAWKLQPGRPVRHFSIAGCRRAALAKLNPRRDEDGKDMTIEISERAAKRLRQITSAPLISNSLTKSSATSPDSHLRVTVTSGGCHGFQYLMSLEGESKIDKEEDTIFIPSGEAGEGRAEVVMDSASLELLKGSTIDYTTELIGSQFKIVGNPRAKSSCGCGTSFDID